MFILALVLQAVTVFPTVTAPPQHNPMVITTASFQSEVDPLDAPLYIYGNLRAKGELQRTETLAPYERKFLNEGHSDTALQLVASNHNMQLDGKNWIVVHGNYISEWKGK